VLGFAQPQSLIWEAGGVVQGKRLQRSQYTRLSDTNLEYPVHIASLVVNIEFLPHR